MKDSLIFESKTSRGLKSEEKINFGKLVAVD